MARWWDNLLSQLKGLIQAKVKIGAIDLQHFGDRRSYNIHITVNQSLPPISESKSGVPVINLAEFPTEQKRQLLKVIKDAVIEEDALVIKESSAATIKAVEEEEASPEAHEVIETLRPLVSEKDLIILRSSLHLRQKYQAGNRAAAYKIKAQIMARFGERGRNIANLCTAGYIGDQIVPLAKEVGRDPKLDREAFLEIFNFLVGESAFAVFVPNGTGEEQIKKSIFERIKVNRRYGLKYVPIHGIGAPNIQRIPKCALEMTENIKGLQLAELKSVSRSVYVRLEFTSELGAELMSST